MAVNKVDFYGETLIDISDSTVTSESLSVGVTAYNSAGEKITGTKELTKDGVTTALGYTPVKSVNGKTGETITLTASDVGAVSTSNYLTSEIICYVNEETGNDSNTGLSSGHVFATLQGAINAIPKDLGGLFVRINLMSDITIESGTSISINSFFNGRLNIRSFSGQVTISGNTSGYGNGLIKIKDCGCYFNMAEIIINQAGDEACVEMENDVGLYQFNDCTFQGARGTDVTSKWYSSGIRVYSPMLVRLSNVIIENSLGAGIYNVSGIILSQNGVTIRNNNVGIANNGGLITGQFTMSGNGTNYQAGGGGRTYSGGQTSTPNY